MNKFDRTVINGFIKFNILKDFIKFYQDDRQAILYYARHATNEKLVNELTEFLITFNDSEFLADYALYLNKELNVSVYEKIIYNLVKPCVSYHKYENIKYLCRLARHITNLSKKQKEYIFNVIASSNQYYEIYRLAKETKLDKSQKSILTGRISSCNDCNLIEKYLKDVKDLDGSDIDLLVEKIIKLGSDDYFDLLSLKKISDSNKENLIDAALATNNADYIFSYCKKGYYSECKNRETLDKFIDKFIELNAIRELVVFYVCYIKVERSALIDNNLESKVVNALVSCDEQKEPELAGLICHLLNFKRVHYPLLMLLKNKLIQLKNAKYIAQYIILSGDTSLVEQIFGDTLSFCLFCVSNKLCEDINDFVTKYGFVTQKGANIESLEYKNYVDNNIGNYNKNVAIKK